MSCMCNSYQVQHFQHKCLRCKGHVSHTRLKTLALQYSEHLPSVGRIAKIATRLNLTHGEARAFVAGDSG